MSISQHSWSLHVFWEAPSISDNCWALSSTTIVSLDLKRKSQSGPSNESTTQRVRTLSIVIGPTSFFLGSKGHIHWQGSSVVPRIDLFIKPSRSDTNWDTLTPSALTSKYMSFFFAFESPSITIMVRSLIPLRFSMWRMHGKVFMSRK